MLKLVPYASHELCSKTATENYTLMFTAAAMFPALHIISRLYRCHTVCINTDQSMCSFEAVLMIFSFTANNKPQVAESH